MEKNNLHPRNRHRFRYDFKMLCAGTPELSKFIIKNKHNSEDTIDFSNQEALKFLNKAILKFFYQVSFWDIPPHYLCPPVPGRADYIHYAADLLESPLKNPDIRVLDIGVGANCIYPLIGHQEYGWKFVGSEIESGALMSAKKIIDDNHLEKSIELRTQENSSHVFKGIIRTEEHFDLSICNPPFHASMKEAALGSQMKNRNLGIKNTTILNFGGQSSELWCEGGEALFIKKMIEESAAFAKNCRWFSTLVSKKENLSGVYGEIKRHSAKSVRTFEMSQGQKISRFVAWSFKETVCK